MTIRHHMHPKRLWKRRELGPRKVIWRLNKDQTKKGDQLMHEEDPFLDKAMPPQEEMTREQLESESPTPEQDPFLVKGLPARVPKETSETEGMETDYGNVVVGQVTLDQEFTTQFIQYEPTEQDIEGVLDKGEMMIVDTSGIEPRFIWVD